MNINIKATNTQLTPAIREYIEKKLAQVESKLIDPDDTSTHCDVEVGKTTRGQNKGEVFRAEFNLSINGKLCRTESVQENLYAAIDEAKDELYRRVKKDKNKQKDTSRRGMLKMKRALRGLKW